MPLCVTNGLGDTRALRTVNACSTRDSTQVESRSTPHPVLSRSKVEPLLGINLATQRPLGSSSHLDCQSKKCGSFRRG